MNGLIKLRTKYLELVQSESRSNKARIRLLMKVSLSFIGLSLIHVGIFIAEGWYLLLLRSLVLIALFSVGIGVLYLPGKWKITAHLLLTTLCLLVWTNIVVYFQGVNVVTLQYAVIVLSLSFYTLEERWGTFYSFFVILPIAVSIIGLDRAGPSFLLNHQFIHHGAFSIALIFNFGLLIFIHYFYIKALRMAYAKEKRLKGELKEALVAAEVLAEAKTNFLSTMSHELRTPLNAVIGISDILMKTGPREDQLENMRVLRFSADNLMAIINDILDFNRLDAVGAKLETEVFAPAEMIRNLCGTFRPKCDEKHIAFHCSVDERMDPLWIKGDKVKLVHILFNLVGNSVKFTHEGFISLSAVIGQKTDTTITIRFSITDSGIGIPEDRQTSIFDPFVQVQHRSRRHYHGTGLGLTIAHRLVCLHGSELVLKSVEGQGTNFSFSISYELATPPIVSPKEDGGKDNWPAKALQELRVLVAEDELVNVMIMKKVLGLWGITPVVAGNGQEALAAMENGDFDVVLMDINMPVMDGFEASRRIRELTDPRKASVHIIAVTASIGASMDGHDNSRYLDDFMLKPFKADDLQERLEAVAKRNKN
ncbi:ATP-binding protein [Pedobacter sp. JY14-1]|uniref:ATP-binding protein n=1 Tax=Pedobacter sp. JY14-1 TaxID=3034151 RepID=UPI0023E1019C|nr:ATP-binding protein [Pedobacter sp. JY14-1]